MRVIRLFELEAARRLSPSESVSSEDSASLWSSQGVAVSSQAAWPEPVGSARDSAAGELDTQPCAPEWPRPRPEGLRRADITEWPVTFRAEAQDYARLWWRQALWCVLSLGLYLPWARRQSRHFFLQHTFVAGRRFDHEQPLVAEVVWQGMVVSLLLGMLAALQGEPLIAALAVSVLVLVWPVWLGVGHAQCMSALRWGRRPLSFRAPWWRVYRRLSPWVVMGLLLTWTVWWGLRPERTSVAAQVSLAAAVVLGVALAPVAWWTWWSCRQRHLGIGPLSLSWRATVGQVYVMAARVAIWGLGLGLALGVVYVLGWAAMLVSGAVPLGLQRAWAVIMGGAWCALVWPYAQAHAQNLVWQETGCRYLRFRSRLSVMGYVGLKARHLLWLVGTLGLAWPWVAVQSRRVRLEAVTVVARVDPADLRAAWREPALPRHPVA